jgi:putative ABC transport system permease protein
VRAVIVDYTSELGAIFLDRKHFLEYFGDDVVDGIFVYLAAGVNEDQVATALRNAADGGAQSSTVFVSKTKAIEEHILGNLRQTFAYSRAVELMTLLIALMGVVGTMAAAVLDRQREISMLRAIGATTRQVALAIVVEAGFLGFCAAISGIVLGIFECRAFFDTLLAAQTGWHMEFVFPWSAALRTGALVVATSALAGALPAWRAARMPIVGASVHE